MIKSGGENVASREVEDVIYRLAEVSEVAVIGLPHPPWIEAIAAVIVPKEAGALTQEAVVAHCRCPACPFQGAQAGHLRGELPKNASGKIMKRALREQHQGLFG